MVGRMNRPLAVGFVAACLVWGCVEQRDQPATNDDLRILQRAEESNCKKYNTTVAAWKKLQSEDLASVGVVKVTPTKVTSATCTFAPPAAPAAKTSGARQ